MTQYMNDIFFSGFNTNNIIYWGFFKATAAIFSWNRYCHRVLNNLCRRYIKESVKVTEDETKSVFSSARKNLAPLQRWEIYLFRFYER